MKCKDCKWLYPVDNPKKGMCTFERTNSGKNETGPGGSRIVSKMKNKDDEACENFEKGSHRENLKNRI